MLKKETLIKTIKSLLLILILLFIACVSSSPPKEEGTTGRGMNSDNTGDTEVKVPKIKDKIVIPDETPIPENNPESMEMAAAGSNDTTSNTGTRSTSLNSAPAVPSIRDVQIQENNDRITTPEPVIIIRPTPVPEPQLPEKENPGDVWIEPSNINTTVGKSFQTGVHINTGAKRIAAYGIKLFFNRSIIDIDSLKETKIVAGEQGFMSAANTTVPGMVNASGFDTAGKGPSRNLELFIVYWRAVAKGEASISVNIETIVNDSYETIGIPRGISGTVSVK